MLEYPWNLSLKHCHIILTEREFNDWLLVIDSAISAKSPLKLAPDQVQELQNMKKDMLDYSSFDRKNRFARLQLSICELSAFEALVSSTAPPCRAPCQRNYFLEIAADPDARHFTAEI